MFKKFLQLFKRQERPPKTYKEEINDAIVRSNFLGITETSEIEFLKSLPLDKDTYQQVVEFIKANDIEAIKKMPSSEIIFDDLTIAKFEAHGKTYFATICDGLDMWEDFIVIDIFEVPQWLSFSTASRKAP